MDEGDQMGAGLLPGIQYSQWCCDAFLNGTFKIGGVVPLAEQIPAEMLEETLPVPSLSVAVWSSDKTAKYPMPSLPQSLIQSLRAFCRAESEHWVVTNRTNVWIRGKEKEEVGLQRKKKEQTRRKGTEGEEA